MADPVISKPLKQRSLRSQRGRTSAKKKMFGTFQYRGLTLRPTFVNDERSVQLENVMREIAMKNRVIAE